MASKPVSVESKPTTIASKPVPSKPQMRGLLNAAIKRNLYIALAITAVAGFAVKRFGTERKRKYAEFYRNYDAEKEFEDMRRKGLFQSC